MTRPELIREWRADVFLLFAWAGGAVLALFVILAVSCVIQGALAGRPTRRRGKP